MISSKEGSKRQPIHNVYGPDSSLVDPIYDRNVRYSRSYKLNIGRIIKIKSEMETYQMLVDIELVQVGKFTNVPFPNGGVAVSSSGDEGSAKTVHGLWSPPSIGQYVLVGYIDGNKYSPIILQTYPYQASKNVSVRTNYIAPLTAMGYDYKDVLLGHYIGSYFKLSNSLPQPGHIDISSVSSIKETAETSIEREAKGDIKDSGANIEQTATSSFKVNGATIEITGSGTVKINGSPSVTINSGVRPAAAQGDLVTTMLGPMPIQTIGTSLNIV